VFIVIPHVGKSHLTLRLLDSIPHEHRVILMDGSYVQDCGTIAFIRSDQVDYVPTGGVPYCLAKNWNCGAARVPLDEPHWMFCANDIEFSPHSWHQIKEELRLYPDCGIIKDARTNWNVWIIRRWAWDLIKPMDEEYKPCAGEDDDLNMKCWTQSIKIRAGSLHVNSLEGGHGSRLDIHRPGINSDRTIRPAVVGHFQRKWGILPATRLDPRYGEAKAEIYIGGRRRTQPPEPGSFVLPAKRVQQGALPPLWPEPLRLHLGCGKQKWPDWLNVDIDEQVRPDYVHDIVREPWPWSDVEEIAAYHLIEHLSRKDGALLIQRCFAALKPGGRLAVECPDFGQGVLRWQSSSNGRTLQHLFGNQTTPWQYHLWGYTGDSLAELLKSAGFTVTGVGEGTDYHTATEPCIRVEAVKP
jgi:predicted SAM-dependent methyltransferase